MEGLFCSNSVVMEGFLSSLMEAVALETAISASKALALSLFMTGCLPNGSSVFPEESGTSRGFPFTVHCSKKKPDPDNQDGSDTKDDEDNDDKDAQDDQDDDEDEPGKDSEDPEDEPEANGEAGSDDEDKEDVMMMRKMKTTTTMRKMKRRRRKMRKIFPSLQLRRGNEA